MFEFDSGFQVCNVVGERKDPGGMKPKKREANSGFKGVREKGSRI